MNIENFFEAFLSFILDLISFVFNIILLPINALLNSIFPDFTNLINNFNNFINSNIFSNIGFFFNLLPPLFRSMLLDFIAFYIGFLYCYIVYQSMVFVINMLHKIKLF